MADRGRAARSGGGNARRFYAAVIGRGRAVTLAPGSPSGRSKGMCREDGDPSRDPSTPILTQKNIYCPLVSFVTLAPLSP